MALHLQPTRPEQLDGIAGLLCAAFEAGPDVPFANRRLLTWKYFDAAALWGRPCSFVLADGGALAAHCAVAPIRLRIPDGEVSGLCFMDWASDRSLPFAGIMLKKELLRSCAVAIVTGGTPATRGIIPRLGFSLHAQIDTFARVTRPLRQSRTRPRNGGWKDAARLVRNTIWSLSPAGPVTGAWSAERVERFVETTPSTASTMTLPDHSAELLNHWLSCPAATITGHEIYRRGERMGHFLLARIGGQTRIADLRLATDDARDWEIGYRLATLTAGDDERTCEIVAVASIPLARQALAACGYRWRDSMPLSLYDPAERLAAAPPICWSLIDNDTCYLVDPATPYLT